jgi:OPA family glycerol-3-phosphate transporter-like MFS transporter
MAIGLFATAAALIVLAWLQPSLVGPRLPLVAIGTAAFCLLGPYSYLGGAFALDFGGKQGSALSSGLIDGVGYAGAVLAGYAVARVQTEFSWRVVFEGLAIVSLIAAVGAAYLHHLETRAAERVGQQA